MEWLSITNVLLLLIFISLVIIFIRLQYIFEAVERSGLSNERKNKLEEIDKFKDQAKREFKQLNEIEDLYQRKLEEDKLLEKLRKSEHIGRM